VSVGKTSPCHRISVGSRVISFLHHKYGRAIRNGQSGNIINSCKKYLSAVVEVGVAYDIKSGGILIAKLLYNAESRLSTMPSQPFMI
jgi:hypothetical protein